MGTPSPKLGLFVPPLPEGKFSSTDLSGHAAFFLFQHLVFVLLLPVQLLSWVSLKCYGVGILLLCYNKFIFCFFGAICFLKRSEDIKKAFSGKRFCDSWVEYSINIISQQPHLRASGYFALTIYSLFAKNILIID